jgi:hypothetical protein
LTLAQVVTLAPFFVHYTLLETRNLLNSTLLVHLDKTKTPQNQSIKRGGSTEGRYKTDIPKEIKRNKTNKNQQVTKYLFSFYFHFLRLFCHFLRPICAPNKIK